MILAGSSVELRNHRVKFPPGRLDGWRVQLEELTGGAPSSAPPLQAPELLLVPQQPPICFWSPPVSPGCPWETQEVGPVQRTVWRPDQRPLTITSLVFLFSLLPSA